MHYRIGDLTNLQIKKLTKRMCLTFYDNFLFILIFKIIFLNNLKTHKNVVKILTKIVYYYTARKKKTMQNLLQI